MLIETMDENAVNKREKNTRWTKKTFSYPIIVYKLQIRNFRATNERKKPGFRL